MPAVKLSGVKYVLSQLNKVSPEARKNINKEVKKAAKPVVSKARGFIPSSSPLSGWESTSGEWGDRGFNSAKVKSGIGFSTGATKPNRNGYSYLAYFYNKTAAGAIYETAGRKNPSGQPWNPRSKSKQTSHSANPNAGRQFINALGSVGTGKDAGRAIFKAYSQDNGKVRDAIVKTYADVVAKFNKGAL
jgi:hypothetical protein